MSPQDKIRLGKARRFARMAIQALVGVDIDTEAAADCLAEAACVLSVLLSICTECGKAMGYGNPSMICAECAHGMDDLTAA